MAKNCFRNHSCCNFLFRDQGKLADGENTHIYPVQQNIQGYCDADAADNCIRQIALGVFYFTGNKSNIGPAVVSPERTEQSTKKTTEQCRTTQGMRGIQFMNNT